MANFCYIFSGFFYILLFKIKNYSNVHNAPKLKKKKLMLQHKYWYKAWYSHINFIITINVDHQTIVLV